MKRNVVKGTESNIFHIFIQDSSATDGSGLTGLAWNTGSLTAYYIRAGAALPVVEITLVTATVGTFTSGGFKEVDATNLPGVYDFHPPNAAFVTGAEAVVFMLKGATDMAVIPLEIQLIAAPATAAAQTTAQTDLDTLTDATALPGQEAPTATPTQVEAIMYLYKAWSNKSTQTNSLYQLFNRGGATVDQKADVEDASGTFTASEVESGP